MDVACIRLLAKACLMEGMWVQFSRLSITGSGKKCSVDFKIKLKFTGDRCPSVNPHLMQKPPNYDGRRFCLWCSILSKVSRTCRLNLHWFWFNDLWRDCSAVRCWKFQKLKSIIPRTQQKATWCQWQTLYTIFSRQPLNSRLKHAWDTF